MATLIQHNKVSLFFFKAKGHFGPLTGSAFPVDDYITLGIIFRGRLIDVEMYGRSRTNGL
jgi:hypothetical protein